MNKDGMAGNPGQANHISFTSHMSAYSNISSITAASFALSPLLASVLMLFLVHSVLWDIRRAGHRQVDGWLHSDARWGSYWRRSAQRGHRDGEGHTDDYPALWLGLSDDLDVVCKTNMFMNSLMCFFLWNAFCKTIFNLMLSKWFIIAKRMAKTQRKTNLPNKYQLVTMI